MDTNILITYKTIVWLIEEQDLLEIIDLKLFGVKTLVSILIEH